MVASGLVYAARLPSALSFKTRVQTHGLKDAALAMDCKVAGSPVKAVGVLRPHKQLNSQRFCRRHHIHERGLHFLPFASLQTAVGIDPELLGRNPLLCIPKQIDHFGR